VVITAGKLPSFLALLGQVPLHNGKQQVEADEMGIWPLHASVIRQDLKGKLRTGQVESQDPCWTHVAHHVISAPSAEAAVTQ